MDRKHRIDCIEEYQFPETGKCRIMYRPRVDTGPFVAGSNDAVRELVPISGDKALQASPAAAWAYAESWLQS